MLEVEEMMLECLETEMTAILTSSFQFNILKRFFHHNPAKELI